MVDLEFELDFLVFVLMSEKPGLPYAQARSLAMQEIKEERNEKHE